MSQQPQGPPPSVSDVLFGSGVTAAQLDQGVEVGGPIVGTGTHPVREFDPLNPGRGAIKTYPSGDPIFGVHVDVQTQLRESPTDDGVRRLYVDSQRFKEALRDAVRAGGAQQIEPGGALYVVRTGKVAITAGVEANTYVARYVSAANAQLGIGQPQQATPPVPPPPQQWQQQPPPQWSAQPPAPPVTQPQQQPQPQYQPGQYPAQTAPQWPSTPPGPPPEWAQQPQQPQQQNGTPQPPPPEQQQPPQYPPEVLAAAQAAGATLPGMK